MTELHSHFSLPVAGFSNSAFSSRLTWKASLSYGLLFCSTMTSLAQRIAGREVFVHDGKEISPDKARDLATDPSNKVVKRMNGPHHDSKWARHLLGTDISQNQFRRNRLAAQTNVPA